MHSNLWFLIARCDRVADKHQGQWMDIMDVELELEFECRLTFIGIEEVWPKVTQSSVW